MIDPAQHVISCPGPGAVVGVMNALIPQLAPEIRRRLNEIKLSYLMRYNLIGLYERVNNKTIETVLAEYLGEPESDVIASGEKDGLRYELLDLRSKPPLL